MKFLIALIFVLTQFGFSQSKDPNKIINDVVTEFNRVKDLSLIHISEPTRPY